MIKSALSMLILAAVADYSLAATLIERDGRYEVNWTTGKVRFYGVGTIHDGDENFRAAEQRAWADGLRAAEMHLPKVMSGRLGFVDRTSADTVSKLAAATVSVSTSYFGDRRVKVLLEAPLQKVTPQLTTATSPATLSGGNAEPVVIRLAKGAKPAAFVRIVDDQGKELVNGNHLASSVHNGGTMPRWFRSKIDGDAALAPDKLSVISGTSTERGVIKVNASDWKPAFAVAVATGAASFVVE
jgi:hypothetical protein